MTVCEGFHVYLHPYKFLLPTIYRLKKSFFNLDVFNQHLLTLKSWFFGHVGFMIFNAIFNNILAISWRSVLMVEETGVPGENHRPVASH